MAGFMNDTRADDVAWDSRQDWHVYERAERAKGDSTADVFDKAGAKVAFEIRLEKARALDKARKELIVRMHEQNKDVIGFSFQERPEVTRTVDGRNISDDEIRL